jgi:hypothetical protein
MEGSHELNIKTPFLIERWGFVVYAAVITYFGILKSTNF